MHDISGNECFCYSITNFGPLGFIFYNLEPHQNGHGPTNTYLTSWSGIEFCQDFFVTNSKSYEKNGKKDRFAISLLSEASDTLKKTSLKKSL